MPSRWDSSALPTLADAVLGSNPLPKGGTTLLFAAWICGAIAIAAMRRDESAGTRALATVPVAMAFFLLAMMLLRLGPSPAQGWGSTKIQLYMADNFVFMVGAVYVGTRGESRRLFLLVTFACLAIGALYVVGQLASGAGTQKISGRFSIGTQEYPIYLGRDSATGLLIGTYLVLASPTRRLRLLATAALPVLAIALLASGSRGPVVAFVVAFFALVALAAADRRRRRQLGIVVGALLIAAVLVPFVVPGSAVGRSLSTIIGSASGLSSNGRSSEWANAFAAFSQNTWLGLGTGGFAKIDPILQYPHNILLEVGVELGILGVIAVVVMIGSMFRRLISIWRAGLPDDRLESSLLIALLLMALVNALFSGAIQDNRDVWVWGGIGIGMYAGVPAAAAAAARYRRMLARPELG